MKVSGQMGRLSEGMGNLAVKLYTPKVYSEAGLKWIDDNSMRSVLLRHFPELAPALEGVENRLHPGSGRVPAGARRLRRSR